MIFVCRLSRLGIVIAVSALGSIGCKAPSLDPPPPPPFKVKVAASGDPGRPLSGVKIGKADKVLATTAADGQVEITLDGADGEVIEARVQCPDGYTSPDKPLSIRLSRSSKGRPPLFSVSCAPTQRHVVVAVKADNGANLPVVYLGKVVTHTDESGAASFALEAAPGEQFQVTIDTSGKEGEKLSPLSPTKPFTVGNADDIFVFDQKFAREKKKIAKAPKPHIPRAL